VEWLVASIVLSIVLTVVLNVLVRVFPDASARAPLAGSTTSPRRMATVGPAAERGCTYRGRR
jgi:hypothetical protein